MTESCSLSSERVADARAQLQALLRGIPLGRGRFDDRAVARCRFLMDERPRAASGARPVAAGVTHEQRLRRRSDARLKIEGWMDRSMDRRVHARVIKSAIVEKRLASFHLQLRCPRHGVVYTDDIAQVAEDSCCVTRAPPIAHLLLAEDACSALSVASHCASPV